MKIPSAALEQRKEILKAFAAKHCVRPDLCEQVCVEDTEGKVLFYVRERRPVSEATAKVMDGVIRLVCERCGNVSPGDVLSDGRRQELVTARNIIVLILREHYGLSLHDCGAAVNRHHATALLNLRRIKDDIGRYPPIRAIYHESCRAIGIAPLSFA